MHTTLAQQLFSSLRKMDAEAVPLPDGTPTGLHGYKAFVDGVYKAGRGTPWENCWSDRLAELLADDYPQVERECRYVGGSGRQRCDLVLGRAGHPPIWIEVKGCWRVLVADDNSPSRSNSAFLKHLHKAAIDIDKLLSIRTSEASQIGMLLVGFETSDRSISDRHLQVIRDRAWGWEEFQDEWADLAFPAFKIRCWFWSKQLR